MNIDNVNTYTRENSIENKYHTPTSKLKKENVHSQVTKPVMNNFYYEKGGNLPES